MTKKALARQYWDEQVAKGLTPDTAGMLLASGASDSMCRRYVRMWSTPKPATGIPINGTHRG
jgi:hypothetical protein